MRKRQSRDSFVSRCTRVLAILLAYRTAFGLANYQYDACCSYFKGDPDNNLRDLFHDYVLCEKVEDDICTGHGIFSGHDAAWAGFAWAVFRIAFWTAVAGELHRRKWYWAL